ncbi:hypothetical protein EZV62_018839 [Acer yangbiense]|uniref:Integrase catalytic domain-containing protein n=1 Tax=Acer yangbiense TaxID=1000413 RepID=A0A5C7H8W8_9ROSI|nr:hypothetical protein EZV62_018839 [Acer yangbiense]
MEVLMLILCPITLTLKEMEIKETSITSMEMEKETEDATKEMMDVLVLGAISEFIANYALNLDMACGNVTGGYLFKELKSLLRLILSWSILYSDVWGPAPTLSGDGYRYYIVFVNAYTRYSWTYPLHLKSEALVVFVKFRAMVELQLDKKIKVFQADMGGEYIPFVNQLSKVGIQVRFSCPHTHRQNGVPERKHRSIVEMGLTLLDHGGLPMKYWFEAFCTATLLINNLPSSVLGFLSPFEKLYHRNPNYNFFKVFGCSCFPYLRNYSKHKLDFHSSKCVFIGYNVSHKGYRCLHPSGRIFVSRNVVFNELEFPYKQLFGPHLHKESSSTICSGPAISNLFNLFSNHRTDCPTHTTSQSVTTKAG